MVVLRDLERRRLERSPRSVHELPRDGLPNYFDDQRFGSVGFRGGFTAQAWLTGRPRASLAAGARRAQRLRPSGRVEAEKAILRDYWGNWAEAKARLERSHARSIVTYLVDHPADFRGAFARIRRELRSLYFSAFQSHLWNLLLARTIERLTRPEQRVPLDFKVATLPIHHGLDPEQAEALAAVPHAPCPRRVTRFRTARCEKSPARSLAGFGLAWEDLRVKHLKDVFFSKGVRPALFFAENLTQQPGDDELDTGPRPSQADSWASSFPRGLTPPSSSSG